MKKAWYELRRKGSEAIYIKGTKKEVVDAFVDYKDSTADIYIVYCTEEENDLGVIKTIEKYYRERYNELVKSSMSRLDNKEYLAEEAVQEAFFRAIKYYKSYNKDSSLDSWFRSVLFNCINLIKSQERSRGVTDYQENLVSIKETGELDYGGNTLDIKYYLSKEKGRNAEVVRLYYLVGLKSIEISEFMNIKHSNVRQILYEFRRKMREFID